MLDFKLIIVRLQEYVLNIQVQPHTVQYYLIFTYHVIHVTLFIDELKIVVVDMARGDDGGGKTFEMYKKVIQNHVKKAFIFLYHVRSTLKVQ